MLPRQALADTRRTTPRGCALLRAPCWLLQQGVDGRMAHGPMAGNSVAHTHYLLAAFDAETHDSELHRTHGMLACLLYRQTSC